MIVRLADLSTDQAAAALAQATVAVLPMGAIEQHGPHLALRTDIAIAESLAARVCDGAGQRAVLLPGLSYGLSEHHLAFSGTITLRPDTIIALILDVVESLAAHGIHKLLIVNGHGGNIDAIRLAARRARRDFAAHVAHAMWGLVAGDRISAAMLDRGMHNHGCEVETSLALELDPALIRGELPGQVPAVPLSEHIAPPRALIDVPLWFDELSPERGYLGDPSRATQEWGQELSEVFVERVGEFLRGFADSSFPGASAPGQSPGAKGGAQ